MSDENQKKILIVDDDVRMRELLQRYLTEQGFTIQVVADSKEMDCAVRSTTPCERESAC